MVNISCGKVDPISGDLVTAETLPTPDKHGRRQAPRSATHPPIRAGGSTASSAHSKSSTMPITTPSGTTSQHRYQYQRQHQQHPARNGWSGSGQWRGRGGQTHSSKKPGGGSGGGGGGLLKDMFERARSKAEEKKENLNSPPTEMRETADLQDVSEIVIACASGQTPARGDRSFSPWVSPAAVPNPFAKKAGTTAVRSSRSDFRTPCALTAGCALDRSEGDPALAKGYVGGDADAWSRLSKGCLMPTSESRSGEASVSGKREGKGEGKGKRKGGGVVRGGDFACTTPLDRDSQAERDAKDVVVLEGTVSAAAESAGVKPVAPKRCLSSSSRGGHGGSGSGSRGRSGSGRGKKKMKIAVASTTASGKGATLLSFFGRAAAASKP